MKNYNPSTSLQNRDFIIEIEKTLLKAFQSQMNKNDVIANSMGHFAQAVIANPSVFYTQAQEQLNQNPHIWSKDKSKVDTDDAVIGPIDIVNMIGSSRLQKNQSIQLDKMSKDFFTYLNRFDGDIRRKHHVFLMLCFTPQEHQAQVLTSWFRQVFDDHVRNPESLKTRLSHIKDNMEIDDHIKAHRLAQLVFLSHDLQDILTYTATFEISKDAQAIIEDYKAINQSCLEQIDMVFGAIQTDDAMNLLASLPCSETIKDYLDYVSIDMPDHHEFEDLDFSYDSLSAQDDDRKSLHLSYASLSASELNQDQEEDYLDRIQALCQEPKSRVGNITMSRHIVPMLAQKYAPFKHVSVISNIDDLKTKNLSNDFTDVDRRRYYLLGDNLWQSWCSNALPGWVCGWVDPIASLANHWVVLKVKFDSAQNKGQVTIIDSKDDANRCARLQACIQQSNDEFEVKYDPRGDQDDEHTCGLWALKYLFEHLGIKQTKVDDIRKWFAKHVYSLFLTKYVTRDTAQRCVLKVMDIAKNRVMARRACDFSSSSEFLNIYQDQAFSVRCDERINCNDHRYFCST